MAEFVADDGRLACPFILGTEEGGYRSSSVGIANPCPFTRPFGRRGSARGEDTRGESRLAAEFMYLLTATRSDIDSDAVSSTSSGAALRTTSFRGAEEDHSVAEDRDEEDPALGLLGAPKENDESAGMVRCVFSPR